MRKRGKGSGRVALFFQKALVSRYTHEHMSHHRAHPNCSSYITSYECPIGFDDTLNILLMFVFVVPLVCFMTLLLQTACFRTPPPSIVIERGAEDAEVPVETPSAKMAEGCEEEPPTYAEVYRV